MAPFILEAVVGLFVAAFVATFGYASGRRSLQKKIDDAAIAYVMELDDLINKSVKSGEFEALTGAREIVKRCVAFREPLDGMRRNLNAEIDTLIRLTDEGVRVNNCQYMLAAIVGLQASWPGKRRVIEQETRKLLVLLGVE